jgi:predicted RNase H-like nuclease (RuvC/YqgF family)
MLMPCLELSAEDSAKQAMDKAIDRENTFNVALKSKVTQYDNLVGRSLLIASQLGDTKEEVKRLEAALAAAKLKIVALEGDQERVKDEMTFENAVMKVCTWFWSELSYIQSSISGFLVCVVSCVAYAGPRVPV